MAKPESQAAGQGQATDKTKETENMKLPMANNLWDGTKAPEYGGTTPILEIEAGAAVGPLTYIGINPMNIQGKNIDVHVAQTIGGEGVRLPIAASFLRAMQQANIGEGDKFLIKRYDDVKKKQGVGAGQDMQIFGVKIVERAAKVA